MLGNSWKQTSVARKVFFAALCLFFIVGFWWLLANAHYIPAYGDTVEYLALSRTLKVDQYRTIFYPAILRICGVFHEAGSNPSIGWTYLLQVLAVLVSSIPYTIALLKIFAPTDLSTRKRFTIVVISAVLLAVTPLIAHFSLSVMSDSLASSLTVATVGSLSNLAASIEAKARKSLWLVVSALCLAVMALSRVDKLYLGFALTVTTIACLQFKIRRLPAIRGRVYLAGVGLLLCASIAAAAAINRFTQVTNPSRPPLDISSMAFNRVVWPRLTKVYPYLSDRTKAQISEKDAELFDSHNNNVYPLLVRLLAGHPENRSLVNEMTRVTLQKFPLQVVGKTVFDFTKYMLPNVAFPLELVSVLPESIATDWTYTRMSRPYPHLTFFWLLLSTGIFYLFELPAAIAFLKMAKVRGWAAMPIAWLTVVAIIGNALLFSFESGMDAHIRYALPTFVILQGVVTVFSLLWFFGSNPVQEKEVDIRVALS
jgi:hypothetical protein